MRSKFTHLLMLTAWLFATGSHWDVVQVFAWGNMFANNARVLPVLDAAELTFSPTDLCSMCQVVRDGKQDGPGDLATGVTLLAKEPLVFQTLAKVIVIPPEISQRLESADQTAACERSTPPTPPPRTTAVV